MADESLQPVYSLLSQEMDKPCPLLSPHSVPHLKKVGLVG